jgi:hypothetical protein
MGHFLSALIDQIRRPRLERQCSGEPRGLTTRRHLPQRTSGRVMTAAEYICSVNLELCQKTQNRNYFFGFGIKST